MTEFRNYTEREVVTERVYKETQMSFTVMNPSDRKLALWIFLTEVLARMLDISFRNIGRCNCTGQYSPVHTDPDNDDYAFDGSLNTLKSDVERIDFFAKRMREEVRRILPNFRDIRTNPEPTPTLDLEAETEVDHYKALDAEHEDHDE